MSRFRSFVVLSFTILLSACSERPAAESLKTEEAKPTQKITAANGDLNPLPPLDDNSQSSDGATDKNGRSMPNWHKSSLAATRSFGETIGVFTKLTAKQAVEDNIKKSTGVVDLSLLRMYPDIRKEDLSPLANVDSAKHLKELALRRVDINDEIIEPISKLRLERLDLENNKQLHDLHALRKMTSLKSLSLAGVPLSQSGYETIKNLRQLEDLTLADTAIDHRNVQNLYGLTHLNHLNLENCLNITTADIAELRHRLPACRIDYGPLFEYHQLSKKLDKYSELIDEGRLVDAERGAQTLIDSQKNLPDPDYEAIARAYTLKGMATAQAKDVLGTKAEEYFQEAIKVLLDRDCSPDTAWWVIDQYAYALEHHGQVAKAAELRSHWDSNFDSSLAHKGPPFQSRYRLKNLLALGHDYYLLKKEKEAAATYNTAARVFESSPRLDQEASAKYLRDWPLSDALTPQTFKTAIKKLPGKPPPRRMGDEREFFFSAHDKGTTGSNGPNLH